MAAICSAAWCVLHVSGYAPRHSQQLVFYLRGCKLPDIRIFSVSEKRIFTTACGCDFPLLNSAVHVQYNLWSNLMALFYNAIVIFEANSHSFSLVFYRISKNYISWKKSSLGDCTPCFFIFYKLGAFSQIFSLVPFVSIDALPSCLCGWTMAQSPTSYADNKNLISPHIWLIFFCIFPLYKSSFVSPRTRP